MQPTWTAFSCPSSSEQAAHYLWERLSLLQCLLYIGPQCFELLQAACGLLGCHEYHVHSLKRQDCCVMGLCIAGCGWLFLLDDAHVQAQALACWLDVDIACCWSCRACTIAGVMPGCCIMLLAEPPRRPRFVPFAAGNAPSLSL